MHILQFFEKSSQKPKQTIWACQKCKTDIKYENPGENGPLGQKLGHFATMYPYSSPDHIEKKLPISGRAGYQRKIFLIKF